MMKRWKSKPQRLKPITKAWRQNIFGKKKLHPKEKISKTNENQVRK